MIENVFLNVQVALILIIRFAVAVDSVWGGCACRTHLMYLRSLVLAIWFGVLVYHDLIATCVVFITKARCTGV